MVTFSKNYIFKKKKLNTMVYQSVIESMFPLFSGFKD